MSDFAHNPTAVAAALAKRDLFYACKFLKPTYLWSSHHKAICDFAQEIASTPGGRGIIEAPPRHGKSTIVSQVLPTWYVSNYPARSVMVASYAASLAVDHTRESRMLYQSEEGAAIHGLAIRGAKSGGSNRQDQWQVMDGFKPMGGFVRGMGVRGGSTGKGYGLGIIDDPIKDAAEAMSQTYRNSLVNWLQSVFFTRQSPTASLLMMMTRWDDSDVVGWIKREMERDERFPRWKVLTLPAISVGEDHEYDPRKRAGLALWPEMMDLDFLEARRAELGSRWFSAMYQCRPPKDGGGNFKGEWFPRFGLVAANPQASTPTGFHSPGMGWVAMSDCSVFAVCDLAASESTLADYTATGIFARTPTGHLLVLHMYRDQIGVEKIVPRLQEICREWCPEWLGIEATGFQTAIARYARRAEWIPPVRELATGNRSKLVRATPAMIVAEQGMILLPDSLAGNRWITAFVDELEAFRGTGSGHDDQVDVLAYAQAYGGGGKREAGGLPSLERRESDVSREASKPLPARGRTPASPFSRR